MQMADLSNRPLLPSGADRKLYVEREAVDGPLDRALSRGRNTLVHGERGSGRTSALHAHALDIRERGTPVAYCDLLPAGDFAEALELIGSSIDQAARRRTHRFSTRYPQGDGPLATIEAIRRLGGGPDQLVVMLDSPDPEVAFALFGRHREDAWALGYCWAVATSSEGAAALSNPPADAFFERAIELFPLNAIDRRKVLQRRAPEIAATPLGTTLMETGPENMRAFITVVREVLESDSPSDVYLRGIVNRQTAASELGRAASMALAELEALGPISASDDRFLKRLGWTKARASKVLNSLQEAGLVTSSEEIMGPGRPRKVYRLRPPEVFA
jgi:hypothetical protein